MKVKAAITSLRRESYITTSMLKSPLFQIKTLILIVVTFVAFGGIRSIIRDFGSMIIGGVSTSRSGFLLRSEISESEENLILNPRFVDGTTSSWKTFGKSTLLSKTITSAKHGINVASTTGTKEDWHGISQKIGPHLTEGARYRVSAFVQLDTADQNVVQLGFREDQDDHDHNVASKTIDFANEWVQLEGIYTASSDL